MANAGYVYVLMNPSMQGLVKVGKTNRDPTTRVGELSSATGVPTPFSLIYSAYFNDCTQAEGFAHAYLESKGYRLASNREFFLAPTQEAIDAVLAARKNDGIVTESEDEAEAPDSGELASALFRQAEDYYRGYGDCLQDFDKAFKLYQQASSLGHWEATHQLGSMYRFGDGRPENLGKALEFYEKSTNQGHFCGYMFMADIYLEQNHIENFHKCWRKLFDSKSFWEASASEKGDAGFKYLETVSRHNLQMVHLPALRQYRDAILAKPESMIEFCKSKNLSSESYERDRTLVLRVLFPETKLTGIDTDKSNEVCTNVQPAVPVWFWIMIVGIGILALSISVFNK